MEKDTSEIPFGTYCYDYEKKVMCPYWDQSDELPEQENGICNYLETNDWEINGGDGLRDIETIQGEKLDMDFGIDEKTGKRSHFPLGLLWDSCKECDVNFDEEEQN